MACSYLHGPEYCLGVGLISPLQAASAGVVLDTPLLKWQLNRLWDTDSAFKGINFMG